MPETLVKANQSYWVANLKGLGFRTQSPVNHTKHFLRILIMTILYIQKCFLPPVLMLIKTSQLLSLMK